MRSKFLMTSLALVATFATAGCSGADEHPLGGPYGGAASTSSGPTQGQAASASGAGSDTSSNPSGDGTGTEQVSDTSGSGSQSATNADAGSGSSSSSSSKDAGSGSGSTSTGSTAVTWTSIFTNYLASGTTGDCASCHSSMSSASGAYSYLKKKGQISGSSSALASSSSSCLSWLGGDMPPGGPSSNAKATADLASWANAGGLQN